MYYAAGQFRNHATLTSLASLNVSLMFFFLELATPHFDRIRGNPLCRFVQDSAV